MDVIVISPLLRFILFLALVLFIVGLIPGFTPLLASVFGNPIVQILLILAAIRMSYYDMTLSILLIVAFLISIGCCSSFLL